MSCQRPKALSRAGMGHNLHGGSFRRHGPPARNQQKRYLHK
jgi:hypothetical protein